MPIPSSQLSTVPQNRLAAWRQKDLPTCPEVNTWVQLHQPPTPFCFHEALLLCPESDNSWVAWIPDYGETVLHRDQFVSS